MELKKVIGLPWIHKIAWLWGVQSVAAIIWHFEIYSCPSSSVLPYLSKVYNGIDMQVE